MLAGGFDVAMLILDTPTAPGINTAGWLAGDQAMIDAAALTGARAAVVATLPECLPESVAEQLSSGGIAPMVGLDDALGRLRGRRVHRRRTGRGRRRRPRCRGPSTLAMA